MRRLGLAVVIASVLAGCGASSHATAIKGRWGSLIKCLKGHPLFDVYSADAAATARSARTNAVVVLQDLNGHFLAYLGNNAMGADDLTGSGGANVSLADGPIHYGFSPFADTQNRSDIENCVTGAYGSVAASSSTSSQSTTTPSTNEATTDTGSTQATTQTVATPATPHFTCGPPYVLTWGGSCASALPIMRAWSRDPSCLVADQYGSPTSSICEVDGYRCKARLGYPPWQKEGEMSSRVACANDAGEVVRFIDVV